MSKMVCLANRWLRRPSPTMYINHAGRVCFLIIKLTAGALDILNVVRNYIAMARTLILYVLMIFPCHVMAQRDDIKQVLEETCECLKFVVKNSRNKYDFDRELGKCTSEFSKKCIQIDSSYADVVKLNKLIHTELKSTCKRFQKINLKLEEYASQRETDFIVKTSDCQILKAGVYIELGDVDSTQIHMSDTLQIVNFKDGTYTKSRVVWLDLCSYKIIRIESTNSYESQMVSPGQERVIRIIGVENQKIFLYELEVNGRFYQGKLVKQ